MAEYLTPNGYLPSVGDEYRATCGCVYTWTDQGWRQTTDCDRLDGS